ncbi:5-formyltetrahydrofolate cyclo-ligase [Desulfotalea psychrophila]|uniref:5-formyltetrahydrofolate cyclo-ligase n=1 Tax=Desulfotalea psychrophila (strain LSv54 / DSM 12343) TaxID=177439 RepID=Q6AQJ8_DESPS|nr:5-formyltetrahydrofolate cyclo-ligase [Desulfotalea psychrophila]CAG35375.1 probable 5-formyltetrahydrofolate cyclo-ligase [Desulfotalea psychrophila LSv54]
MMNLLRREVLIKRKNLSDAERFEQSKRAVQKLSDFLAEAQTVFVYLSYNGEVETFELVDKLLARGFRVTIPWTSLVDKKIIPVEIFENNFRMLLEEGPYGISQPSSTYMEENSLLAEEIDVVICPGSLFDRRGGRMGYGGGFYDRFLSGEKAQNMKKIGLCFQFQLFDIIEQEDHDVKMNYIVTDREVLTC